MFKKKKQTKKTTGSTQSVVFVLKANLLDFFRDVFSPDDVFVWGFDLLQVKAIWLLREECTKEFL